MITIRIDECFEIPKNWNKVSQEGFEAPLWFALIPFEWFDFECICGKEKRCRRNKRFHLSVFINLDFGSMSFNSLKEIKILGDICFVKYFSLLVFIITNSEIIIFLFYFISLEILFFLVSLVSVSCKAELWNTYYRNNVNDFLQN